jgi:hypothetical protein
MTKQQCSDIVMRNDKGVGPERPCPEGIAAADSHLLCSNFLDYALRGQRCFTAQLIARRSLQNIATL